MLASFRAQCEGLARDIRVGKSLFARAIESLGVEAFEPPSKALEPTARKNLEAGCALLRDARRRAATFATSLYLGKVELRLGRPDAALDALRRATALAPDRSEGHRELSAVYLELERAEDALPCARRALELRPDDAELRCNLAVVLRLIGDVACARDDATAALAASPGDPVARGVATMIDDVVAGRRLRPRSLAAAEGRARWSHRIAAGGAGNDRKER